MNDAMPVIEPGDELEFIPVVLPVEGDQWACYPAVTLIHNGKHITLCSPQTATYGVAFREAVKIAQSLELKYGSRIHV